MSFLRWFGKKGPTPESVPSQSSDLGQVDATVPILRTMPPSAQADKGLASSARRNGRLERRELLYGVVRECMTGAGLLSSTYKFKVLSLDSNGRQYLIMMDMPRAYLADPAHFAEIEGTIARSAKERYDILVTAVYWRVNDMVISAPNRPVSHAAPLAPAPEPLNDRDKSTVLTAPNPYAPIQPEEVLAFKRAVASATSGTQPTRHGETRQSGRQNPEPVPDFSDTEPFEVVSPLGTSQFGGLS